MTKVLLVGETNPLSSSLEFALWPAPPNCSGWRLCYRVLNMSSEEYLDTFDRVNLCVGPWSIRTAREAARGLAAHRSGPIVLLGSKVCEAFGVAFQPLTVQMSLLGPDREVCILPHPSGRSRAWNDPSAADRARQLVTQMVKRLG